MNKTVTLLILLILNAFLGNSQEEMLNYSKLNKPSTAVMENVDDWLSQFKLVCENSVTFLDRKTAEYYGGDQPILELHGKVTLSTFVYDVGITYTVRSEYEGALYQLFIPLLKLSDVKKHIERLCKNMGGCIQPEEMEITFEETEFGVKVSWGGGC